MYEGGFRAPCIARWPGKIKPGTVENGIFSALDGLLFYKVDRASRNLFDYVELERLESEYELPFISVSQPTESTPAGRWRACVPC